jgi:hypothetical protein
MLCYIIRCYNISCYKMFKVGVVGPPPQDPIIAKKIETLVAAGIIQMR